MEKLFDVVFLIQTLGLVGVWALVFAESGLFFGFFLPGDSLLFTAGLLASQGVLPFWPLLIGTFICAVLGDSFGYYFGSKVGPKLFYREDSTFFKKRYMNDAKVFFEKYGKMSLILARFMPIIRTFTPIAAGVGQMTYRDFIKYNIIGGFLWAVGLITLGYTLGSVIPNIDRYLWPIIILIIILSIAPGLYKYYQSSKR